jgi:predicted permease
MRWSGLRARWRDLWNDAVRREAADAETVEEFQHHMTLRTADLIRQGLAPAEAARRARVEFGPVEPHRADARAARGLRPFDEFRFSAVDLTLGVRMIRKHPGLSAVSIVGMAVAIAIGAGGFAFIGSMLDPRLPLPNGERIVALQNEVPGRRGIANRRSLHSFVRWREQLRSVQDVGAFIGDALNLLVPGGGAELVQVARMSASGFRAAGVPPILGRPLLEEDEREGGPAVIVIGEAVWRRLFDADSNVVGRTARLGGELHTVVGVMPDGFRFPVRQQCWIPLRLDPDAFPPGAGPSLYVFGRLADGVTLARAQAELSLIGSGATTTGPEASESLRARVLPYTAPFLDVDNPAVAWALRATQLAISMLLVLVAANVAVLVYARTAIRTGEIAVRTALGASRRRIVAQLFAEALVLSGVAAVAGLALAGAGLRVVRWIVSVSDDGNTPFWEQPELSVGVIVYAVALGVVAAVITGVLPALKATGRQVQVNLQRLASHGSGMTLGRTWTVLIVTQVAVAVALMPFAVHVTAQTLRRATLQPEYPVHEFVRASVALEGASVSVQGTDSAAEAKALALSEAHAARFREIIRPLLQRLESEPEVAGVTFASRYPGGNWTHERFEADGAAAKAPVLRNAVDVRLFEVFGVRLLAGRGFVDTDGRDGGTAVIVNRAFVDHVLRGGNPLGRRVRAIRRDPRSGELEPGPWREIVGVVPEFTVQYAWDPSRPGLYYAEPTIYEPMALDEASDGLWLAVHVRGAGAARLAIRLHEIASRVDPALQLRDVMTDAGFQRDARRATLAVALGILAVTLSVLLLSAAGISAMMAFTVARRRRETGIRAALGADPRRLLTGIFAGAARQLGGGALAGLMVALALDRALGGGPLSGKGILLVPIVAALFVGIGLLATWGPARRGLSIQPTEALRAE